MVHLALCHGAQRPSAGHVVAIRVESDPTTAVDNGVFTIFGDHLGSASAMTDDSGTRIGEVVRYYPFGGYRDEPSGDQTDITNLGFTGHKAGRLSPMALWKRART